VLQSLHEDLLVNPVIIDSTVQVVTKTCFKDLLTNYVWEKLFDLEQLQM